MLEQLKEKAIESIKSKASEQVESDGHAIQALVKFSRLDSVAGQIKTDFTSLTIWIEPSDLALIGDTVSVRGTVYDVVHQETKALFNGTAEVSLTEPTTAGTGTWR